MNLTSKLNQKWTTEEAISDKIRKKIEYISHSALKVEQTNHQSVIKIHFLLFY